MTRRSDRGEFRSLVGVVGVQGPLRSRCASPARVGEPRFQRVSPPAAGASSALRACGVSLRHSFITTVISSRRRPGRHPAAPARRSGRMTPRPSAGSIGSREKAVQNETTGSFCRPGDPAAARPGADAARERQPRCEEAPGAGGETRCKRGSPTRAGDAQRLRSGPRRCAHANRGSGAAPTLPRLPYSSEAAPQWWPWP